MPEQDRLLPIPGLIDILEQFEASSPLFEGAAKLLAGHLLPACLHAFHADFEPAGEPNPAEAT